MKTRSYLTVALVSLLSAVAGVYLYSNYFNEKEFVFVNNSSTIPTQQVAFSGENSGYPDLTFAAEKSVHAVVHVKVKMKNEQAGMAQDPFYEFFFGRGFQQIQPQPIEGAGSGVILTESGYIVTNNHVIENANEIEVVLNDKRSFTAKLIGTDTATDIALLKIEGEKLPYLNYGNSDDLKVGEWVLAVGNPFNLTSTVTAGIVSAKSRSISMLSGNNKMGIESFIQTDAAVNPGNSGGALVDVKGQLVGINTAIASRTGSYSGYSFAVPVSIVKKVVNDIMEYGKVQRAMLGIQIQDVNAEVASKLKLDKVEGVLVAQVNEGGAASEAGIKSGDVIISIDGDAVNSSSALQEKISQHRPGEKVTVMVKRDGDLKQYVVNLKNIYGSSAVVKDSGLYEKLGVELSEATDQEKAFFNLQSGIKVNKVIAGKFKDSSIREGFIIVKANNKLINSVDDFKQVVDGALEDGLFITGVYPNGKVVYYAINLKD